MPVDLRAGRLAEPTAVAATLAFARPADVVPDERPGGQPRAHIRDLDAPVDERSFDLQRCRIYDCSAPDGLTPDLHEHGFAHVDLSALTALQAALERVRAAGELHDEDVAEIRGRLRGVSFPLASGKRLRLLHIASEGFFMRRAGPNGMKVSTADPTSAGHHHQPARVVHIDQDVDGTPLRQILRGTAPWLFRHDSPTHANRRSPLHLLNLWIPLDQVTAPLALLDRRTLDRRAHQLRYGLPTSGFLARAEDRRVNDIWTVLHDPAQRWCFTSDLDARRAYVFETLSTAHGSFILPGEDEAEALYRQLERTLAAIARRDETALEISTRALPPTSTEPTPPLRRAIDTLRSTLADARAHASTLARGDALGWSARARDAMNRVVRKSLELRVVAVASPWSLRS